MKVCQCPTGISGEFFLMLESLESSQITEILLLVSGLTQFELLEKQNHNRNLENNSVKNTSFP